MTRKPEAWERRRLVRRAGGAAVLAFLLPPWLAGCRDGGRADGTAGHGGDGNHAPGAAATTDDRPPRVLSLPDGGLGLVHATEGLPVAYVSTARRIVWVDRAWRDRAHFVLGAYTSVSTGLWRIPLPGDDPRAPIAPGDEAREFEARDMEAGDLPPVASPGDMRVRAGRVVERRLDAACLAVPGGGWLTGGPWTVPGVEDDHGAGAGGANRPGIRSAGREMFVRLGAGTTHAAPGCSGSGVTVDVFGWRAEPMGAGGGDVP